MGNPCQNLDTGDQSLTVSYWPAETRTGASACGRQRLASWYAAWKGIAEEISEYGGLAFSSSGKFLVSGSYDNTARVWDVATGKTMQILKGHNGTVKGVAFSPDEKRIATSSTDKRLMLWEVESGQRLKVFDGHQNSVVTVGFVSRHPYADTDLAGGKSDAYLLVSSSLDRILRVWDTDSGVTLRFLQGHTAGVSKIAVHAAPGTGQGVQVFSTSNDGTVRRWDIASLPYQQ